MSNLVIAQAVTGRLGIAARLNLPIFISPNLLRANRQKIPTRPKSATRIGRSLHTASAPTTILTQHPTMALPEGLQKSAPKLAAAYAAKYNAAKPETDASTLSNYESFKINHTKLRFEVDWTAKALVGKVEYDLTTTADVQEIVLDTSYLDLGAISVNGAPATGVVGERLHALGCPLTIALAAPIAAGSPVALTLEFATTSECTALQWLDPPQTAGKKVPYLFSQCQAIHARSMFPCFDTSAVKSTYDFEIVSEHFAVASGNTVAGSGAKTADGKTVYLFTQTIPIPSYLVAIASGDLVSAPIGPRSLVYSEPSSIDACQYEFEADTEKFIAAAEEIVFPYDWKTYNVLVLPPSFPYGGMENPNITFATPTLISGDRQNVDVIAHELAHSWSGNLVTSCSWEHFWLNEGWTVYLERRIVAAIHGEPSRHLSSIIGWSALAAAIEALGPDAERFSPLVIDLTTGRDDPDDAFSSVPYEKGSNLLYSLELALGKAKFDPFIPHYFTAFKGRSLDTYQFVHTLFAYFAADAAATAALVAFDWDTWLFAPGMPPKPAFDTALSDAATGLAARWTAAIGSAPYTGTPAEFAAAHGFAAADIDGWTSTQLGVFLENLAVAANPVPVRALDSLYGVAASSNPEVLAKWYALAVPANVDESYAALAAWLGTVGRMKFVRPGYRLLETVDPALARETFKTHASFYHPICRAMVEKDLGLK
ncbi:LAP2 leucyl aminopeptidase yscIV [Dipodascopsis tothii]|uniref:LAP2 leucyl aminopeptidase yscIV n=1 Tax=Dipodascopsis tothii TaxID=44089 RepID=UPI0034D0100E